MGRKTRGQVSVGCIVLLCAVLGAAVSVDAQIPTESDVYVDRGILAYDNRQFGEALQALTEALRLDPANLNALYYLGLTRMALEQLAPAQEALEQARALAPTDQDILFQLGVSYFQAQQYDKAEPLFRQVQAQDPRRQNLGYYLGFIEYRKQNYREAARQLQANVPSDQAFAQLARFYAGLSLSALGLSRAAQAEIEEAIRSQPVSPLVGPAERFREVVGKAARTERDWAMEVKLGVYFDDNVAVIPNSGIDPAVAVARNAKHRSAGELGLVRFEYFPLRTPDWDVTVGGSVLGTYNNDVQHYNVLNPAVSTNATYKGSFQGMESMTSLFLQYDYMMLDDRNYSNRYTLAPSFTLAWNPMNVTQALARYQYKDYMHEKTLITTSDDRDGSSYMAGLTHYLRFQGDRYVLKAGYQYDMDATVGSNWNYGGHRLLIGGQITLPWYEIKLRDDFDVHFRQYENPHTYLPTTGPGTMRRKDTEYTNMVTLFKEFPRNITVALEYLYDKVNSNIELFSYTRNVITLSVNWRY
jgi:tetratricopeptide (TPR) repeat protein